MTEDNFQMLLFSDLPVPPAVPRSSLRVAACRAVSAAGESLQLAFSFVLRVLDPIDPYDPADQPVHRMVRAADLPPVKTTAPASIFTLADAAQVSRQLRAFGRFGDAAGFAPAPVRIERDCDGVRVIRLQAQETEEWQERERARRAKQRPPKPVRAAKTRGKKVRGWDGEAPR